MTRVHAAAASIALLTLLTFWTSTALSELSGDGATILQVKTAILYGMGLLIPALITTAATGNKLAGERSSTSLDNKRRRMPFIAANGLLVLVPSAFFLHSRAASGTWDTAFYAVQALEMCAGALNITLLSMSARDGMRLTGRWR